MTPKEKAKELTGKFLLIRCYNTRPIDMSYAHAKQCALIAVDEALNVFIELYNKLIFMDVIHGTVEASATYVFWQEVKQEIEKL